MMTRDERARGSALIVSLMLLLVLTLIGVTAMRTTVMEERMSGNLRDRNLAFQAAEAAMRDAESFIEGLASTTAFDGSGGLYGEAAADPDYFAAASWVAANSRAYGGTPIAGVASQPRYIIKYLGETQMGGNMLNIGGYGGGQVSAVKRFRITVLGTGGSDNSQVVLQNHYARRF